MTDTKPTLTRRDWVVAASLAAVAAGLASYQMVPHLAGPFHDDGVYVALGKALAQGEGLRLINLPDEPLQRKYPILYPAILAVIWKAWPSFPGNVLVMQAFTLVTSGLFFGGAYLYLVRFGYAPRAAAVAVTALSSTAPLSVYLGGLVLSEFPFALFLLVSLWRLERELERSKGSVAGGFTTGVLVGLPFLIRSIGVCVPAAGTLVLLMHRRLSGSILSGLAVAVGPWIWWTWAARAELAAGASGYYTDYVPPWKMSVDLAYDVVATNTFLATFELWSLPLARLGAWLFGSIGAVWPLIVALGLFTSYAWVPALRQRRLLPWVLGAYFALVVVWLWPPTRFLVPVLPLVIVSAVGRALADRRGRWPLAARRVVVAIVVVLATGVNVWTSLRLGTSLRASAYPTPTLLQRPVQGVAFDEMFRWVKANTRPEDVVAAPLDPMLFLYADRRSFRPIPYRPEAWFYGRPLPTGTYEEFEAAMVEGRAAYLAFHPLPNFAEEPLFQALVERGRRRGLLRVVFQGRDPRFIVFAVARPPD